MKDKNNEFVQRIKKQYVGDDCVQVMIPHRNGGITILNCEGMQYHYKPNSTYFLNNYESDKRKEKFPYSNISSHKAIVRFKKYEFINQLLDYNKVYIDISDDLIKEFYAKKDGKEALVATKIIIPNEQPTKYMTRSELEDLIKSANLGIYCYDGSTYIKYSIASDDELVNCYKKRLIEMRKNEEYFNSSHGELTNFIVDNIDNITIDNVPKGVVVIKDSIFVFSDKNEINSIKSVYAEFVSKDNFMVRIFDYPITIYSLEHLRKLEQTNLKATPEPKISTFLNPKLKKDKKEFNKTLKLLK